MAGGGAALGLPTLLRRLIEDARNVARAEIRLFKARAFDLVRRSRIAILLLIVALLAVQGAVVALMVGLVLQLAPMVGAAWAGVIVMAVLLFIAGLLAWSALRQFSAPASAPSETAA
jgi:hypothetical protein